jgi:hypothetical protein
VTDKVHLGMSHGESGDTVWDEKVDIEIFHTLFSGQTNLSGKTTTIKTLIPRAVELGYTVLVFDTKATTREFEGFGVEVPVCYRTTTDALVLIGLLESIRRARLSPLYATLSRATEGARSMGDIIDRLEEMELSSRSGFIKDACHTLVDLLKRLLLEMSTVKSMSTELKLVKGAINVMAINDLSTEAQQLVLKTAFELVMKWRRLIVVIDEGFQFLPQDYSSACKRAIQDVVTQGAKTKLFVWVGTQFLATIDKPALKPLANKLLGRQDHNTEVEHTQKLIPDGKKAWPTKAIMTLKRGEFIFVPMEGETRKVYIDNPTVESMPVTLRKLHKLESSVEPEDFATGGQVSSPGPLPPEAPKQPMSEETEAEGKVAFGSGRITSILTTYTAEPRPETKELASFKLNVTRLEGKVMYLVKEHPTKRQGELLRIAHETYGWNIDSGSASRCFKQLVQDGLLFLTSNKDYRIPERVTVEEVPA